MSYAVREAQPSDKIKWNEFAEGDHPGITPYHLYEWREAIGQTYDLESKYLIVEDEKKRVKGILPFFMMGRKNSFGLSLPYCTHAGIAGDNEEVVNRLRKAAVLICRESNLRFIELRETAPSMEFAEENAFVAQVTKLEDTEQKQWQKLKDVCKRNIKKAEKSGLEAFVAGKEAVSIFHGIYANNVKRLGTPSHPEKLFSEVLKQFGEKATLILIKNNRKVVAGMLLVKQGNNAHDPWVSSLEKFNHLRPNELLYWSAIKWAIGKGCLRFDFGRSRKGSGVYQFKSKWGTKDINLIYRRIDAKGNMTENKSEVSFFQSCFKVLWPLLPDALSMQISPFIRKYIP